MSIYEQLATDLEFFLLRDGKVIRSGDDFIPDPHQIFPSRFLAPHHRERRVLLLDYQMGTGKTLAGAMVLAPLIKRLDYLRGCLLRAKRLDLVRMLPIPYVIGNWSTIGAFRTELFRPMFGIVEEEEFKELQLAIAKEDIPLVEEIRSRFAKRLRGKLKMYSYQKMFNRYFRGATALADKTRETIYEGLSNGEITIDSSIESDLCNSILIVDEPQTLYSFRGLNTYGILLEHIWQNPNISNLTLLYLSGTFINTSPVELIYLANLIRPRGSPPFKIEDYYRKELATLGSVIDVHSIMYTPIKHKIGKLLSFFDGKVAIYSAETSPDYPTIRLIGDLLTIDKRKFKWLKLKRCYAPEYQWKEYMGERDDDEEESVARDFVLPPKEKWSEYGISPVEGVRDVYRGTHLTVHNLKTKFGAIPGFFIQYLLDMIKRGQREKVVAYHRRVERGGLLQYAEALRINGFVLYGEDPLDDSICYMCGKPLKLHARVSQTGTEQSAINKRENIKKTTKASIASHVFVPAVFALLTGKLSFGERNKILVKHGSPANNNGERMFVLLISGVAEKGVTVMATNHMIYLDSIPGIPLWKQIGSRIARHSTHTSLPPDRRRVDVITPCLAPPPSSREKFSREEFRYLLREINDEISTRLWSIIRSNAVNCPFIHQSGQSSVFSSGGQVKCKWSLPSKFRLTKRVIEQYNTFYYIADVDASKTIITECINNIRPIWKLKDLRNQILSNKIRKVPWNTSYVSDEAITEAVIELCEEQKCYLITTDINRPYSGLSTSSLTNPSIILARGSSHQPGIEQFTTIIRRPPTTHGILWIPLLEKPLAKEELQRLIVQLGKATGNREKLWIFDQIVGRPDTPKAIHADFKERGPIYQFLYDMGAIVWEGDDSNIRVFCRNRLRWLEKDTRMRPIGVIIGPNFYKYSESAFEELSLPLIDQSESEQWEIAAIFAPGTSNKSGRWHPRFKIRPKPVAKKDMRKVHRGMACLSIDEELIKVYDKMLSKARSPKPKKMDGRVAKETGKTQMCNRIQKQLLELQLSSEELRYVYSFFEAPASLIRE